MSIKNAEELAFLKEIGEIVGTVLQEMRNHAAPGMSAKELDEFGGQLLNKFGARSAPKVTYDFPGYTCICTNQEIAHGIPKGGKILKEGDLINIDVSAEKNGYFGDNGSSFVLGNDLHGHQALVDASKNILEAAIRSIKGGVKINHIGRIIETEAKKRGYKVIRNLAGHGIGRSLHEQPDSILNYYDRWNRKRFKKNSVIAVETFISTKSTIAMQEPDGWTLIGNRGGYVAQHEHTLVVTDDLPMLLTESNGIFSL